MRLVVSLLTAAVLAAALSSCSAVNTWTAATLSDTSSNYAAAKSNLQTINDQKFALWVDGACGLTIGALKRNATDNNNAVKAALMACPIPSPSSTVSTSDLTSTSSTATATE